MIWHILGAGAIGQLFATRLMDAGIAVRILSRQVGDYYQLQLQEGKDKRHYQLPIDAQNEYSTINHLLVCTKAPDTEMALRSIQDRIASGADILLMQNGMGQHDLAETLFPQAKIWAGVTTAGAWRSDAHSVHCIAQGTTEIGRYQGSSDQLPCGWNTTQPTPLLSKNIQPTLWRKLAINCAINPLTAIHQCLNGELVKNSVYLHEMKSICHEVEAVLSSMNLNLFQQSLFDEAVKVANNTAQNRSSMLTDVLQGRPTEIDYITGYLCERAKTLGIDTPWNDQLLLQVKNLS